jgi:glycerol-3-phosphate acyltransferase PlsY
MFDDIMPPKIGLSMEYLIIGFAYLIGSIPFGLVFGKCIGVDVRGAGSGNIGATNVNRLLGKKMGVMTLAADALKAVLPMLLTCWILAGHSDLEVWVVMAGGAAFVGHLYPVYLKFKGGKGVATALGIFLFLKPVAVLLVALVFVLIVYLWGYVSLGSIIAAAALPLVVWLLDGPQIQVFLAIFIGSLIWLKHWGNIIRLINHEENKLGKKGKSSK